jgi:hypothetical protein
MQRGEHITQEHAMTLQQFLATDVQDDYGSQISEWTSALSLTERFDAQDELTEMFRLECEGQCYEGDHDLEYIFNAL